MPELPEVEVVRRGLAGWITGRTISAVAVLHPRAVRRHEAGADDFAARLVGRAFLTPRRRGKYLWIPLGDGEALLAHLGMSGQLLLAPPDRPYETHLRVRLALSGKPEAMTAGSAESLATELQPAGPQTAGSRTAGPQSGGPDAEERPTELAFAPDDDLDLRFVDQRTFGHLMLTELVGDVPAPISHIAMDPLEDGFDDEAFYRALRRRRTAIKRALLDQSLISGVGNIYADEALWRARLHWARPTETMTRAEVARLLAGVRAVMSAALAVGGTSFDSLYVDVNGESGYFGRALNVYGRRDEPCPRCGTPIGREAFMNRSSYSCPTCQPRPRRARF